MTFFELLRQILHSHPEGMTPQQLRDTIKTQYPEFYGTESHRRNVQRGHYQSTDHALLSQIYLARKTAGIVADRSQKPMKLFLGADTVDDDVSPDGVIETENFDKLEAGIGPMYVLGTNLYTKDGQEIIKIGITTASGIRYKAMRNFEAKALGGAPSRMIRVGDELELRLRSRVEVRDRLIVFAVRLRDPESGDLVWGPKCQVDGHVFRLSTQRVTKARKFGHGGR